MNVIPTIWMLGLSFYNYTLTSSGDPRFSAWTTTTSWPTPVRCGYPWAHVHLYGSCGRDSNSPRGRRGLLILEEQQGSRPSRGAHPALHSDDLDPLVLGSLLALDARPGFGVINYFGELIGLEKIDFTTDATLAFPAVLVVDSWMWIPFMALMTLAALGSVPKAELEARVDNLSFWQRLIHVIIPAGKFIIILGILLRTIDVFKTMDLVYLMTNGGPGDRTELIAVALYRAAFKSFNLGYSSALAVLLLFIAIALTSYLFVLNLRSRREAGSMTSPFMIRRWCCRRRMLRASATTRNAA